MRIERLHLIAFGPFSDTQLDFSQGTFQLLYGQNEAGKSSMRRAISAALFGIPVRSKDTFLHRGPDLRIGAELSNELGATVSFKRRKGNKGTLRTLDDDEKTLPDNSLDEFLKGIERERFVDIHCIGHEEFRLGGQTMAQLKGLAGDSLLAASDSSNFPLLQKNLTTDLDQLFASRKKSQLKSILDEYSAAKKEKAEHEVSVKRWESLQRDLEKLEKQRDEIRTLTANRDTERRRLEQLRSALPQIQKLRERESELESLGGKETTQLPSSYCSDDRQACESELNAGRVRLTELADEICQLQSQLSSIQESPEYIELSDEIDDLQHRIGTQKDNIEQREIACAEQEIAKRSIHRLIQELGLKTDFDDVDSKRLQRDHRKTIQQLAADEKALRQRARRIKKEKEQAQRKLKKLHEQQENLNAVTDTTDLRAEVSAAGRVASIDEEIEQKRTERQALRDHAERERARLPYWSGTLEDLATASVPLRETVDHFDDQFTQIEHDLKSNAEQIQGRQAELTKVQQEIAAAKQATSIVTEADLDDSRQRRDHGWSLVKQAWLGEEDAAAIDAFSKNSKLDQAFEASVAKSDDVADRLRRESDRLVALKLREEREKSLAQSVEELHVAQRSLQSQCEDLQSQWAQEWKSCNVDGARSPQEMRGWLQRRAELKQLSDQLQRHTKELSQMEMKQAATFERLRRVGDSVGIEANSLSRLLVKAKQFIETQDENAAQHLEVQREKERLEAELEDLAAEELSANDELQQWEEGWKEAMQWIDSPPNTTADQARELVDGLDELTEAYDAWKLHESRIQSIDSSSQRFSEDVVNVANQVALDDIENSNSIAIAAKLNQKLVDSRRQTQSANDKRQLIENQTKRLQDLQSQEKTLKVKLDEFLRIAGVDSPDRLPHVERLSQLNAERTTLIEQIRNMSGGVDLAEFIRKADGRDDAELATEVEQLEVEIGEFRAQGEEVAIKLKEVRDQIEEIDGGSQAALADQRAINWLSQAHDVAGRYVRLRIAESILRRQVERYREQNKDPLLAKASEYFAAMTCNEFTGLELSYDDKGKPIIVGIRRGDKREEVDVPSMSDGTRDPMFLSLRLAYLQRRSSQHEVMPLVVDDLLIHLDDERALATLRVLAELSKEMQVLFFTHSDRIRQLAETHLQDDTLTVHELERLGATRREAAARKPK